ncbi:type 1 glutamine amidotransferase (plasmid) [Acinetobacter sp. ANC 7454]|uniref:type 1 glutamine amidotransferase n=1 Tax=Acinetobacter thermotolerans TaxID=3151487 RepID=UPI00325B7ECB
MKTLKVHYFQHIEGESLGSCEIYLNDQYDAQITTTAFYALPPRAVLAREALPSIQDVDLLIVMGSTMSANDEQHYAWLSAETSWIREYIEAGGAVIGLCLGAQLIAKSLGKTVQANPEKERGWRQVYAVPQTLPDSFPVPEVFTVLEWHAETFELPDQAIHLAYNDVCQNQMFQYRDHVIGFQFHPEVTPKNLQMYFATLDEDLKKYQGPYVAEVAETLNVPAKQYTAGNQLLNQAIDFVLEQTKYRRGNCRVEMLDSVLG